MSESDITWRVSNHWSRAAAIWEDARAACISTVPAVAGFYKACTQHEDLESLMTGLNDASVERLPSALMQTAQTRLVAAMTPSINRAFQRMADRPDLALEAIQGILLQPSASNGMRKLAVDQLFRLRSVAP